VELLEKAYAPEYMKDLILKLTKRNTRGEQAKIIEEIRDIIDGYFYYDPGERDFVFEAGNQTFKGVAIASGIKYLGMVSILFLAGFLGKKTLLIIDEPETHMHPQWQISFAEVLVKLVKEGSHILLTSHSPYLIEALKIYSDNILGKNKADFYWSKREQKAFVSSIYHVTPDLSPVYNSLAEPYRKLDRLKARKIFS
jgi:predicted ATPase